MFDGHGESSKTISSCTTIFPELLRNTKQKESEKDMFAAFTTVADRTRQNYDGSTALVTTLWNDGGICAATLGDSTFLASLTPDGPLVSGPHHSVSTNGVERRLATEERGGVFDGHYLMNPKTGLRVEVGRCFGDTDINAVLSTEPTIWQFHVGAGGWFVLMSDGVLDPGSSSYLAKRAVLRALIAQQVSVEEIATRFGHESRDDASFILCRYS